MMGTVLSMVPASLTAGTLLIVIAAFTGTLAAALLFYSYLAQTDEFRKPILLSSGIATLSLVVAHLYLTYQFIVGDYTNAYVYQNSADHLDLLYKITGVYANHEGSILFWATLTAIVATYTVYSSRFQGLGSRLVQSLSLGVVATFAFMLVTQSPFTPIEVAQSGVPDDYVPADGSGINALLIDPWMAIHPPITFASYALLVVPFALGVTHFVSLFRGQDSVFREWLPSMIIWLRVSWLLLTAAILFGAIWAYGVLGWGGFWSWDPVETAVLIPWLWLTATLHATNRYSKTGEYKLFAPAAAAFVFPLIIFATTVVRSGVFRSVHSFAAGGIGAGVLFLMVVTGILAIGLPLAYWLLNGGDEGSTDRNWLSHGTIFHAVVLSFAVLAFISVWGLLFPVVRSTITGVEVSVGQDHYNLWSYPVVVAMLIVGGLYALLDMRKRRLAIGATVAITLATLVAAFIAPSGNWYLSDPAAHDPIVYRIVGNMSVLSIVPPSLFFAGTWAARFVSRAKGVPSRSFQMREAGILLIHVGAAVMIIAISFIYLFAASSSAVVVGLEDVGDNPEPIVEESDDGQYTIEVTGYESETTPDVEDAALAPEEVLTAYEDTPLVRGEITAVDQIEGTAVAQLDGTDVWVAGDPDSVSFEEGEEIVALGSLFQFDSGDDVGADAYIYTDGDNMGTVADPPSDVHTPRVIDHQMDITVYEGDDEVASGTIAAQDHTDSEMNTNDPLIQRGLTGDTYIVATEIDEIGAGLTITEYPLANQIWLGVIMGMVGMVLLLVGDRRRNTN